MVTEDFVPSECPCHPDHSKKDAEALHFLAMLPESIQKRIGYGLYGNRVQFYIIGVDGTLAQLGKRIQVGDLETTASWLKTKIRHADLAHRDLLQNYDSSHGTSLTEKLKWVKSEEKRKADEQGHRQVVRLRTSCWRDKRGAVSLRRDLAPLRRKSEGFQLMDEEVSNIGAEEFMEHLVNLDECEDGLYYLITCNHSYDWETGHLDDYDFRLVKYEEGQNEQA